MATVLHENHWHVPIYRVKYKVITWDAPPGKCCTMPSRLSFLQSDRLGRLSFGQGFPMPPVKDSGLENTHCRTKKIAQKCNVRIVIY